MENALVMCMLQRWSNLFQIVYYTGQRNNTSFGMTGAQRTARRKVKDEKRCSLLNIKIQKTHDVRMLQLHGRFSLLFKRLNIYVGQVQDFDRCLSGIKMHMLSQIDLCEATSSQKTHKTILPNLLTYSVAH